MSNIFHDQSVGHNNHAINANPDDVVTGYVDIDARNDDTVFNTDPLNINKVVRVATPEVDMFTLLSVSPTVWSSGIFGTATDSFIKLPDTPSSYAGQALQTLRVNNAQNALEFFTPGGAAVDAIRWKTPVRVATVAAGTLITDFENGDTVDGVVLATGDRILIKNQTTGSENGIYNVNMSGVPTRAIDFDDSGGVSGAVSLTLEGTINGKVAFKMTNLGTIVLGTTALVFKDFKDTPELINIRTTDDWGTLVVAPDGVMRVPLIAATTYNICATHTLPRLLMPVLISPALFNNIVFNFVNSGFNLLCDGDSTPHIWGRNIGGLHLINGNFIDTGNSGVGSVTTLFDLAGANPQSLLVSIFTAYVLFKRVGRSVDVQHTHIDSFFINNLGGFTINSPTAAFLPSHMFRGNRQRQSVGFTAMQAPAYSVLGAPEGVIVGNSFFRLNSGDDLFSFDSALVSFVEIVANGYRGVTEGNFFQTSQIALLTVQAIDDIAITGFSNSSVNPGVDTTVSFAAIFDFTVGQVILIADEAAYDGKRTIVRVAADQKSFDINVAFSTGGPGTLKMVKHTVAAGNPYVRGETLVLTGTTAYNGTEAVLRETDTTFNLPQAFVTDEATGIATSNPKGSEDVDIKALSNGFQIDSMITAETYFLDTGGLTITINTAGVAEQIGTTTWTNANIERALVSTAGVITHLGKSPKDILVNFSATVSRVTGTPTLGIGVGLFKNGVFIPTFEYVRSFNAGRVQIVGTRAIAVVTNDTIELVVINFDNTVDIEIFQAEVIINAVA